MSKFYAVLMADEDGRSFKPIRHVGELLANPGEEMGIRAWESAAFLGANPDPNYWPEGTAVLLECEARIPQPAGAYILPTS
jgi:hypothetical protein